MAKKCWRLKQKRKAKFSTRKYNRCSITARRVDETKTLVQSHGMKLGDFRRPNRPRQQKPSR